MMLQEKLFLQMAETENHPLKNGIKKYSEYIKKIEKLEKRCTSLETFIAQQKQEIKELKNELQRKTDKTI